MATIQLKIYAGIFDTRGRLLLKRRQPGKSFPGDWDLPGGDVEAGNNDNSGDERIVWRELARKVKEEVGIKISCSLMPAMYPAITADGIDWFFVVIFMSIKDQSPNGEFAWVSFGDLNELAKRQIGNRLVSGWGKRMHRLCLRSFSEYYATIQGKHFNEAYKMLLGFYN
jgi:8-oxo-dGTP pyrophosphatase MutT (NUDIX family)